MHINKIYTIFSEIKIENCFLLSHITLYIEVPGHVTVALEYPDGCQDTQHAPHSIHTCTYSVSVQHTKLMS